MKVLIVGGVAGGATTATRLRRLDEKLEIIIFERGEYISFANCGLPYYIGEKIKNKEALILQTAESFKNRFNIEVRTSNEVTKIDKKNKKITIKNLKNNEIYTENYDKLVLATGAEPIKVNIDGIESEKIFTIKNPEDIYKIKEYINYNKIGKAVIIGGGYIGIEMAENLINLGIEVTILEKSNHLLGPLDTEMASFVHNYLESKGVNIILGNNNNIDADIVIMSIGVKPENKLAIDANLEINSIGSIVVNEKMQTSDENIYALGDVAEITNFITNQKDFIPLAGPANKQARVVANNICGIDTKYNRTQGSSILKIFDMTVAMTGINEETAKKCHLDYDKIYISPSSHATYYPGAMPMHIKVIYEKKTGKILGAQIVGYELVDKRCDVLATCIRAKMTAYDLCDIELCYAPPFSSAKDPVNIIGNAVVNILEGKVKNFYIENLDKMLDNTILLDVRTKREYKEGYIEKSINIPLDELRENIDKLDKNKNIIIYCHSGLRSYIACRILEGRGFDVYNLSGGYVLYKSIQKSNIQK